MTKHWCDGDEQASTESIRSLPIEHEQALLASQVAASAAVAKELDQLYTADVAEDKIELPSDFAKATPELRQQAFRSCATTTRLNIVVDTNDISTMLHVFALQRMRFAFFELNKPKFGVDESTTKKEAEQANSMFKKCFDDYAEPDKYAYIERIKNYTSRGRGVFGTLRGFHAFVTMMHEFKDDHPRANLITVLNKATHVGSYLTKNGIDIADKKSLRIISAAMSGEQGATAPADLHTALFRVVRWVIDHSDMSLAKMDEALLPKGDKVSTTIDE